MHEWEKRFEYIVNTSLDFITLISRDYHYEVANQSYIKNIERKQSEVVGCHVKDVWGEKAFNNTIKPYLDRCLEGEEIHYVERFEFGPTWKYMHVSYYPYYEKDEISHALVFSHDISHLGEIEAKLINYEFRDPLTGLFNSRSLDIILEMELEKGARTNGENLKSLLFVSITNLQDIHLNHGRNIGNMLLENTGIRIKEQLRDSDYVFRYEGNELVILLSCLNEEYGPALVAKKVHDTVTIPYRNGVHDISLSCHIGISLFPKDGRTPSHLIASAHEALRRSIDEGRAYTMYNRKIHNQAVKRLELESDMIRAFEKGQFQLEYQPIVNEKGIIQGCETLIRWVHPERGRIPPCEFIPLAEKNGLISSIGKWVIFQTMKNMKLWIGKYNIYTSLNLTPREFENDQLLAILTAAQKQAHLPDKKMIRLECTESMEMENPKKIIDKMRCLYEGGFEIFLDDFGTGYSSLSYLKDLPATTLKLDKTFVDEIVTNEKSRKFLKLIIYLAKNLEKTLIVEGVETEEQLKILIAEGCNRFQGYYFSKPVPGEQLLNLLEKNRSLPADEIPGSDLSD